MRDDKLEQLFKVFYSDFWQNGFTTEKWLISQILVKFNTLQENGLKSSHKICRDPDTPDATGVSKVMLDKKPYNKHHTLVGSIPLLWSNLGEVYSVDLCCTLTPDQFRWRGGDKVPTVRYSSFLTGLSLMSAEAVGSGGLAVYASNSKSKYCGSK